MLFAAVSVSGAIAAALAAAQIGVAAANTKTVRFMMFS